MKILQAQLGFFYDFSYFIIFLYFRTSNNTKENIIKSNGLIKNKSLSARTHHENDLSSSSYIEKLKRLKVYDELLALKKLPISKLIPFDKDINCKYKIIIFIIIFIFQS